MRNTRMILFAGAALAGLAGCNLLPSAPQHAPADPVHSTRGVYSEAVETTSASTASDSTTQRGGHGFGSGN